MTSSREFSQKNTGRKKVLGGKIPRGLVQCEVCGDYKGAARMGDLNEAHPPRHKRRTLAVSCKCDWIVCSRCGVEKMRRPMTNHYDPTTRKVWWSPGFSAMFGCHKCREEIRLKALEPRPYQPWRIESAMKIRGVNFHIRWLDNERDAFVLMTMTNSEPVTNGIFYFVDGTVWVRPQTPEDIPLMEKILTTPHAVQRRDVALADDPEGWFRALPVIYNGTSLSALKAVPKVTTG